MKKVLLKFYDKNNLGDDLFIKLITNRYENNFSIILSANNPYLESIKHLTIYKNKALYFLYKVVGKIINVRNIWLNRLVKKHDLLVSVGGSIFIENNNLPTWKAERSFYQNLSVPYYIVGSNVGPYQSSEFITIINDIMEKAKDVCLRDTVSYELFQELHSTRVATDIAFSLDTSNYAIKHEKIAIFSMINCSARFGKKMGDQYNQEMRKMTQRLIKQGYKVIYMSFCKFEGDELAIEDVMSNMDKTLTEHIEVFHYHGNLEEALALIASSAIIIATRFHAVILGLLFSKKVLPIAYDKKTTHILNDIAFQGTVIDIEALDAFHGDTIDFDSLPINNIDKERQLAALQFKELDKILVKRKESVFA